MVTVSRKCGCPLKLGAKPVLGGEGWMVNLICGTHNHALAKSFTGHPYVGRLIEDEKIIIGDMIKSMIKPKNILLTLKEHNANNCTTMKQVYNHRLKAEDVVRDIFWTHPDAVKLSNACRLAFLIDSAYKTNIYKLPLLDIVGVTSTGMTFSAAFAYLKGERIDNVVWALERFRGIFMRRDLHMYLLPSVSFQIISGTLCETKFVSFLNWNG
ncbi:uncharacterized protein [Glycine max]|uniref:uncharacterized protein n=1 Tax=Glycine max TaxID=3847 RepID=UPI0003DEC220|nr:uncharacterized protein LOC102663153 [Glycine max]|eukprot:XP_006598451.1 uncharacterized protein LOC102663153 [Glycine max]